MSLDEIHRQRADDLETLARMAARLAGRSPDAHIRMKVGSLLSFDDVVWRSPQFLARAETAYDLLRKS